MTMNYRKVAAALLILLNWRCSDQPWSKEERVEFMRLCRDEGGTKDYCQCYLEVCMEHYPVHQDIQDVTFEEAVELAENCLP